jgi:hypothetical protein
MATALLITRDDIVRLTALNGNTDVDKYIQFVKIAQDIHIQNYLGTKVVAENSSGYHCRYFKVTMSCLLRRM